MTEEYIYDKDTGVLLNGNAIEYKIPTRLECDKIERTFVETRSGGGAYGSTGTAEFFHDYAVVCLAVHNAIGKWVSPPLTPDKVLKALGKA
jgi:CO/xanthine dehydrogenase Mo-binding subunit